MKHTARGNLSLLLILGGMILLLLASAGPASAQNGSNGEINDLTISINMTAISISESDHFSFHTIITNNGNDTTGPLVAHLNVASLQKGPYVDPEDWSSQRTIFVDPIGSGDSANLSWEIHGLFAGNFSIYVVVMSQDTSSTPIVSEEILVHIEKWEILQIDDVTPVVIAVPILMGLIFVGQRSWIALQPGIVKARKSDSGKKH